MSPRRSSGPVVMLVACVLALSVAGGSPALAQESATPTTTPFMTPDTNSCPNAAAPPPPIDESEVPAPGSTTPPPLPVPAAAVGGATLANCGVSVPAGAPPVPADISATGWMVADLDTGEVIAAKDPHGRYRPASTIKTLLALVVLENLDLNKAIVATADDANAEGSRVGIGKGGTYTNFQLLQGLLLNSGNDAAHAFAAQLGGDAATVTKMNQKAEALGALDTRTATPAGLDGPGMSCSAYDLALIFKAAMSNPVFAQVISTETVGFPGYPKDPTIPDDKDHPPFNLSNDDKLLYNYDGALGGKPGYTDDARQTFVGAAARNGRRLEVTIMKSDVLPIRPWEQGARLLDYGFALGTGHSIGTLVDANTVGGVGQPGSTSANRTAAPTPTADSASSTNAASSSTATPKGTGAVRIGIGIVAMIMVVGLVVWARLLSRK